MKTMKKQLSIFLSIALLAPFCTGCDNGLDEYPSDAPITAPSDKFTTHIQFVSHLDDQTVGAADYTAFDDYVANTLDGEDAWLTILDRADNGDLSAMMQTALNAKRWTAFAFNRMASAASWQGSMLYFNSCLHSGAQGLPSGDGCYVTAITVPMQGVRTDKDEAGEITGTASVSFDVDFLTARFDTAEQIAAFGGRQGLLRQFYDANVSLLMVGTVRNDLFAQLASAAQSASGNNPLQVTEVAKGANYTIFMLSEGRFWGFNGVEKQPLASGIEAYDICVMW
ncbi:MAG: hypothetical protein NC250_05030 [Alistipes senegalensis]|nr:hypothetical protein [Bacteroides cellulosilyticus]MCM1352073.1 hypothetical protein [Alistipes senegalensis]